MVSTERPQHPTSTFVDPFATATVHAFEPPAIPAIPRPCAQVPPRTSREAAWVEAVAAHTHAHRTSTPQKSVSMSSAGDGSTLTSFYAADPEKGSHSHSRQPSTYTLDREKAAHQQALHPNMPRLSRRADSSSSSTIYSLSSLPPPGQEEQEQHTLKILLFLSFPLAALSWLLLFWLLIAILITTLSQPVRLCARRLTYSQQLSSLLGPALNLQLKSIYTPLPPHANEAGNFHAGKLVLVLAASPVLSMGVALAAWVVAAYWLMAGIVGDPAGMDKRDDGKETVLGLRRWWEGVLMHGVVRD